MIIPKTRELKIQMPRRTLLASLNGDGRWGLALALCLGFVALLAVGGPEWTQALRYQRTAIVQGEWWRLLSGHWVHLGWHHLLLDSAGLVLLWALYARELRPQGWLWVLVCATASIDAGLWWGDPQVEWYVGISGLLHGAWAAGAAAMGLRHDRAGGLMLVILAGKLVLEHRAGAGLVSAALPVVTAAHVYGALGGVVAVGSLALAGRLAAARQPL